MGHRVDDVWAVVVRYAGGAVTPKDDEIARLKETIRGLTESMCNLVQELLDLKIRIVNSDCDNCEYRKEIVEAAEYLAITHPNQNGD